MRAKNDLIEKSDVEKYIADAPAPVQPLLRELRQVIKAAAPKAEERISYGMPSYDYLGRLVYFAAFKRHVGLYAVGDGHDSYAKGLSGYLAGKSTARFPIGRPLPSAAIRRVVQARVKENEAAAKEAGVRSRRMVTRHD